MLRSIIEGQIAWLPGLTIGDLPQPLPGGMYVHAKGSLLGLEAQGVAGSIPLRNGETLQITPKIGQVNFLRMLFLAEGSQGNLRREYDEFVALSVEDDESLNTLVARQLMVSVAKILHQSPMIGRVERKRRGVFACGRIDPMKTAMNIAAGRIDPVEFVCRERTTDIPENRVVSEAICRASLMLSMEDRVKYGGVIDKWNKRFPRSNRISSDLIRVEEGFSSSKYGGPRGYYNKALMLAQIILGSFGVGAGGAPSIEGDAALLNTADVFERYLRATIASRYADRGYVVTKGGGSMQSLYTDGSYEIEPDIVVQRDGRVVLIADAKYKTPTSSDHYQMNAYLGALGISSGVLLCPSMTIGGVQVKDYSTGRGRFVHEAFLPMNNPVSTEEFLAALVERFA
jgi:5-methylcytosine-specific restriction enzyme subunit McrC